MNIHFKIGQEKKTKNLKNLENLGRNLKGEIDIY